MDPIDKLLTQLNQHTANTDVPQTLPEVESKPQLPPTVDSPVLDTGVLTPLDALDALLNQIDQTARVSVQARLLQPIKLPPGYSVPPPEVTPQAWAQRELSQSDPAQSDPAQSDPAQSNRTPFEQPQDRARQHRLQRLKAQRRQELVKPAKQWLRQLNSRSTEGRWFDEFACNYDSRLEAAIDYLEALTEVDVRIQE
jgi:hypothetical protein